MIELDKIYEVIEHTESYKYSITMDSDFTYIEYLELEEDKWVVKDWMEIPTNYAKVIGKVLVELGRDYPNE